MSQDKTITFNIKEHDDKKSIIRDVYKALEIKGYNPVGQIVGYILSEDPTYITNYNDARKKIVKIDRHELLEEMIKDYIKE